EQFDVEDGADAPAEQQLAEVARGANRKIHKMAQEDSAYAGMGTTFTAALVTGKHIAIGHVGDSRLYRFRDGELERLTHDHSLVEEFVRQGKLTPAEAEVHPQRSIITRALGPEPEVEVDTYTHAGRDGDVYLLNSDGLTGMINEERVAEILGDRESLEDAAEKLIAAANENGGKDNITVVLFRLGSDGADDDGAEEEEPGTLGGQATQVGVSAETVRREVERADKTQAREVPADDDTMHIPAARATQARAKVIEEDSEPRRSTVQRAPPPRRKRPRRRYVTGAIVLVVLAAVVAGLYALDRKFWFVGTNDRGQVTLYRGLPYDLPLGLSLYSEEYKSGVPVLAVSDARQRKYVLDHHARSEGDSRALVRDIERKYARP
ncbi:MAG TPA: protein phosphatase 2C domain-containing protein, partial [Thermoleophilaceae bacterium]|nr:protein phosphatase 2C domain-containing protein [Thermoleophilaceae bacterium]